MNFSQIKKAWFYCKRNGILPTIYASLEQMQQDRIPYEVYTLSEEDKQIQINTTFAINPLFSILVPAYETDQWFLREMMDSVVNQTYTHWELIIVDASSSDKVKKVVETYHDERIRYQRLKQNDGISENSNAGLPMISGEYTALLDHDDLLTEDALFMFVQRINQEAECGSRPVLLYSDEDKCDGEAEHFFTPHYKPDFNPDLLMTNNYICHFMALDTQLLKKLKFRKEYDGAQDFDLVLRVMKEYWEDPSLICHVPKVLYHWRCHEASTAQNPESKRYAYEAGLNAVKDFCRSMGWRVEVTHTRHNGFYRVSYQGDVLQQRPDLAAICHKIVRRGRVVGGALEKDGSILYGNLPVHFSGYMHHAVLSQDVAAGELSALRVSSSMVPVLERIRKEAGKNESDRQIALRFGEEARKAGKRILWDPFMEED